MFDPPVGAYGAPQADVHCDVPGVSIPRGVEESLFFYGFSRISRRAKTLSGRFRSDIIGWPVTGRF
jgi:hypothetical protein